jgi:methenyltetrahydrofolate cyclohydrolase
MHSALILMDCAWHRVLLNTRRFSILEKGCIEFLDLLCSKEPVPGGGGACAYVGALGIALGSMVGNLTLGKKKYQDVEADIKVLLEKSETLKRELIELVDKDAEAFFPLSQAYGLPNSTGEDKEERDRVMQNALVGASEVPLTIARCCGKAIDLLEEYSKQGTRIAISDVGVGAYFAKAALLGAKLNVLINTKSMKDEKLKNVIESELDWLVKKYAEKADMICSAVEKKITGER